MDRNKEKKSQKINSDLQEIINNTSDKKISVTSPGWTREETELHERVSKIAKTS